MILQALTRYYEDLLSRGEIAAPGWAPAKISLALYINENGELTQIVPTMVEGTKGKKTVMQPQLMVLPGSGETNGQHCLELFVGQFRLFARHRPERQAGTQPRVLCRSGKAAPRGAG